MRAYHRAAITAVRALGGTDIRFQPGGKHPRLLFRYDGREHRVIVAFSPSDRRAILNLTAWLRRSLQQEGVR